MKRIASALLVGVVLIMSLSINAFAYRAEWDAKIFDDDNYARFGDEGSVEYAPDAAVDTLLESGWQKAADIMDAQGYISKECFIAFEWEDTIVIDSLNIWWRSSTRAFASTEGYVVQVGTKNGSSYKWTNANVTYKYNAKSEQDGRFVCDTVTFRAGTEINCFRILIKRGMDYERGFSPKVNEVEIAAEIKAEPITPPVSSEHPASSEAPVSSELPESSEAPVSSEAVSSDTSSEASSDKTVGEPSEPTVSTSSESASSQEQIGEQGEESLTPWLVLSAVSILVIGACAVLLIGNGKKSQ